MVYLPKFQPQNPELSHYTLGWSSCTAFSTAMQIDAASLGAKQPTGGQVRGFTGDTGGGLTLAQVDSVATTHYGVPLDVRYRYPWTDFARRVAAGQPAQLQVGYGPIADMHSGHFDAGGGFRGNHDILVMPGDIALDPLADGRRSGIYHYHGERYPADMLERAAGFLNLEARPGQPARYLGVGLVYAAFVTQAKPWHVTIRPAAGQTYRAFGRYYLGATTGTPNRIITSAEARRTGGLKLRCSPPFMVWNRGKRTKRSLVQIAQPGSSMNGWYVSSGWADQG